MNFPNLSDLSKGLLYSSIFTSGEAKKKNNKIKLKNPDLNTSFYFIIDDLKSHVFTIDVHCRISSEGNISYYLYGFSFENQEIPFPEPLYCFHSPEEAFMMADKICCAYPRIESDIDSFHFEDYPEFDKEVFKNEH